MAHRGHPENQNDYDDETGTIPCACGKTCAERDYQGNPARGPRPFCRTDEAYTGAAIRRLPETYAQLSLKLAKSGQQEERISGSREAPLPVDLQVETFMRHIILVTLTWEEQVRAVAGLSNPDLCPACDGEGTPRGRECPACRGTGTVSARDGAALQRAATLLAGHDRDRCGYLTTLLALEPAEVNRPVPATRRIADLRPGTILRIDPSGDAWERKPMNGTDAGLEFLQLAGRARAMLGLSLARRRVAVPCDGCDMIGTLIQREALSGGWEPVVRCTNCPATYIGAQFELLMGREYQATLAQQNAS